MTQIPAATVGSFFYIGVCNVRVGSISDIGVYNPDGTETQRIGIIPDIEIKPTIKGIRAGKDELVEKAIELINADKITDFRK